MGLSLLVLWTFISMRERKRGREGEGRKRDRERICSCFSFFGQRGDFNGDRFR